MDYQELLNEYNKPLLDNSILKRENDDLRKQLQSPVELPVENLEISSATIHNQSPPDEKIKLFMSLFHGREDIYAKRWYSVNSDKSGYSPACGNEWDSELCDKRKYKCNVCPNRKLMPPDEKVIDAHLRGNDKHGRDVVGIYPMLSDETCLFLAVDFDEDGYHKDTLAFYNACRIKNIPAYIERSRSGKGAHVWMFFGENITATLARKLGSCLLTYAMNLCSDIKFISYDRFFPNQDTMPTGGFGNLIALPLQGLARKSGNSVFVDENFNPIQDQWLYLSHITKLYKDEVQKAADDLCKHGELGILVREDADKPWEVSKEIQLGGFDFPSSVNMVRANMLYIEKYGLTHTAINRIKRLAAFKNPDFYKSQAMHMSTYDKPRIISTAEDSENYIGIPRGCENKLIELLEKYNIIYNIDDKTNAGQNIKVSFTGVLREEQIPAAKALLEYNIGVLSATTAFGKTVIGAYIIAERKVNTLVLVHTQALLIQWKNSLDQFLDLEYAPPEPQKSHGRKNVWSATGILGAGKNNLNGIIDIAVMQSLVSGDEVKELVRNYGMIIVDECHHVSAVNFEKILKYANARYIYGLSATPTRQDGHHPIIFMQCGEIRYKVDAKAQAEKSAFEHYVIPRFTSLRGVSLKDEKNIVQVYRDLTGNELRNRMITADIISSIENGRSPIILTERTEHVAHLADLLSGKCKHIITLTGTMSVKEKRETMTALNAVPPDEPLIVIATGKYVGEGFDLPRLDTLFLALPIAWKGKVAQYAGRLHRNYEGKEEVQIYDYVDVHIPVLERMYHKRVKSYASIGYKTKALEQSIEKTNIIYDGKSFLSVYNRDIIAAQKEIVIVSPFMRKNRLSQVIKVLSKAVINGAAVTVITRSPDDFKEADRYTTIQNTEYLMQANIKVIHKSGFHQKFTVIDGSIIWYGSVNFLSFGSNEESIMRLESFDIAGELLDIL